MGISTGICVKNQKSLSTCFARIAGRIRNEKKKQKKNTIYKSANSFSQLLAFFSTIFS
jgi:hypothetical protein